MNNNIKTQKSGSFFYTIKKIIIFIATVIIIIFSFNIPNILLKVQDLNMKKEIYSKTKVKSKIDVQAENIYLVKTIHEIEQGYRDVRIATSESKSNTKISVAEPSVEYVEIGKEEKENEVTKIKNEISKLQECNILKDVLTENNTEYTYSIIQKGYINKYFFKSIYIKLEEHEINLVSEMKTGKIISAIVPKSKLVKNIQKKEILENYVKYLDLYIIGDWKYENNELISEKAQLSVVLETHILNNTELVALAIHNKQ